MSIGTACVILWLFVTFMITIYIVNRWAINIAESDEGFALYLTVNLLFGGFVLVCMAVSTIMIHLGVI
jgi:hypothetical protein